MEKERTDHIFTQIAEGIIFLQSHKLEHGHLDVRHVFMTKHGDIKISN